MNEDLVLILYQFFNAEREDLGLSQLCDFTLKENLCLETKCNNCLCGRQFFKFHSNHDSMNQWRDTCEPIIIRNTTGIL